MATGLVTVLRLKMQTDRACGLTRESQTRSTCSTSRRSTRGTSGSHDRARAPPPCGTARCGAGRQRRAHLAPARRVVPDLRAPGGQDPRAAVCLPRRPPVQAPPGPPRAQLAHHPRAAPGWNTLTPRRRTDQIGQVRENLTRAMLKAIDAAPCSLRALAREAGVAHSLL